MNKKFLAGLATGLFMFILGGMVSAEHVQVVSDPVYDIQPSTTYTFHLDGLIPPAPYEGGYLFISETNADFNWHDETVAVYIDGVYFGAYYFADDNGDIRRTLMVAVPLSFTDLFYITHDGEAVVELTTSEHVEDVIYDDSMYVWIDYEGAEPPDPGALMADLIAFFENGVATGTIVGAEQGNSANSANARLRNFRNRLYSAEDSIADGDTKAACRKLWHAAQRADGTAPPPDLIGGEDAPELYSMLLEVMSALGCEEDTLM